MSYNTQMEAARKGVITPQMEQVIADEKIDRADLIERVAAGRIAIPANRNHPNLKAKAVGEGLSTKINVNLGVSEDCCNVELELDKVRRAIDLKTDAIMDLSTFGDTRAFRRRTVEISPVMIGTVPVYDAVARYGKEVPGITVDDFFDTVALHAEDGVDFITIHAGLNRASVQRLRQGPRLTHVVSRGGSVLLHWMEANDAENPFYEHFDRLLEICRTYDVTISLGDGLRPGSLHDATDAAQIQELIVLGELTRRAWQAHVQVMIEGPGHVPLNEIIANMQLEKKLCHGAPILRTGPHRHRRGPWLRPHHLSHRRCDSRCPWRRFSMLCHPGRTPAPARPGGHERGYRGRQDRRPCGRHRQGSPPCNGLGQCNELRP